VLLNIEEKTIRQMNSWRCTIWLLWL